MRTLIAMHIMMLAAAASICRPLPLRPLHHFSKRCQSGGTGFQLLSWFSTVPSATFLERGLLLAHDAGGCWSLELVACTAAARLLMSSVTMTYIRRLFTRYAMTMHPVNQKEKQLRKEVAQQLAVGSLSPLMARDVKLKEIARLRAQSRELIEQQNIHPGKGFVMVGLEAVFWLSYAVAVRNITAGFPAEWAAVAQQDMGSQGAFWFPDLTLPDPYVLPLIASSTLLFSVQMMAEWRSQNRIPEIRVLKLIRYAAFPLSGWLYYCLSQWPSAISLYMVTSLIVGSCQAYAFTHPAVQRLLRIPQFADHTPAAVSFKQWMVRIGLKRRNPRQMM